MKKISFLAAIAILILSATQNAHAQFEQPLKWVVSSVKVADNLYEIKATGTFKTPGWYIYDLRKYDGGPTSTTFFITGCGIQTVSEPEITSQINKKWDNVFEMEIGTCSGTINIVQKIKIIAEKVDNIKVSIEWQCCNDSTCLPPEHSEQTVQLNVRN